MSKTDDWTRMNRPHVRLFIGRIHLTRSCLWNKIWSDGSINALAISVVI